MNIDLIRNYVLRSRFYSTLLEDRYIIPRFIQVNKFGKLLDLSNHRNNLLLGNESFYSRTFRRDIISESMKSSRLLKPYYEYIREFPIVLDDRSLWNNILTCLGESIDSKKRDTSYFLLDYMFPYFGLAVEIDSEYHDNRQIYDKARDIYVRNRYGLETIRFYKYGENPYERVDFFNSFKEKSIEFNNYYRSQDLRPGYFPIDYSKIIINNYIDYNKSALNFIDKISQEIGETEFICSSIVELTKSDLNNIDKDIFPIKEYLPDSLEQQFINNISNVLFSIYRKQLVILP